jgi:hypothetical protein
MIRVLENNSKKWFLDKFSKSKYLEDIKKVKSDKLVLAIIEEDELKTEKQRKAVHALMLELHKSGLSSFKDYNDLRDFFKEEAGLISYSQAGVHPAVKNMQRKLYSMIANEELKKLYSKSILESQKTVRSVSDATKEELVIMMKSVIDYCYEVELNSDKFQEIMSGLDND